MKPGQQISDYRIIEIIGIGGQAEVALAEYISHGHPRIQHGMKVALKKFYYQPLSKRSLAHFSERARQLEAFDHPNIVHYLDHFILGDEQPERFIVMEYIVGFTLRDCLDKSNQDTEEDEHQPLRGFDWEDAGTCFEHIVEGLIYARTQGFTHRDIKPDNFMILKDGSAVKVLDFDIARVVEDPRTNATRSGNRAPILYMAPEFDDMSFQGDEQSDIYSLGVSLYEVLCGCIDKQQDAEGMSHFVWDKTGLDEYVLPNLKAFLKKATERSRLKRYATFESFRDDMSRIRRRIISGNRNDFQLIRFIGQGGFGNVYAGETLNDEKPMQVAVKRLQKGAAASVHIYNRNREIFRREANMLCRSEHPHIVRYLDYVEYDDDSEPCLIMEYLDGMPGMSLAGRIKANGKLDPTYIAVLFTHYAAALQFLHEGDGTGKNRIIHRDISPDNLYAPNDPNQARLLDLGVARDALASRTLGQLATKWQYAAPEFTDSRGTPQTDIYSLGICLYEAVTGRKGHPSTGDHAQAFFERSQKPMAFRIDTTAPELMAHPKLRTIIDQACHPVAKKRYLSAAHMQRDLQDMEAICEPTATMGSRMDGEITATEPHSALIKRIKDIEKEVRQKRLFSITWKGGAVAAVLAIIASGYRFGPSILHATRMGRMMPRAMQLAADGAYVDHLIAAYQYSQQHAPEARLYQTRWIGWQRQLRDRISELPDLFESKMAEYDKIPPHRLTAMAQAWHSTENIWKDPLFADHQSRWQRIMGRMELRHFAQSLPTDMLTMTQLEHRMQTWANLTNQLANVEGLDKDLTAAMAVVTDDARRVILALREPVTQDSDLNDIDDVLRQIRKVSNLVPGVSVSDVAKVIEDIRHEIVISVTNETNRIADHENAVREIQATHDRLTTIISTSVESLTTSDLAAAMRAFRLARQSLLPDRDDTAAILNAFKDVFLRGLDILIGSVVPSERLDRLNALDMHLRALEDFFRGDADIVRIRHELERQRVAFLLRIRNESEIWVDLETDLFQGLTLLESGATNDFLFTDINAIHYAVPVKLIPRQPWFASYLAHEFRIDVVPGGGTDVNIEAFDFPPRPVTVSVRIPETMPIAAEYATGRDETYATVPENGIIEILPPTEIRVRFKRTGYRDQVVVRDVRIGGHLSVESPSSGWVRIIERTEIEQAYDVLQSRYAEINSAAADAVREDLTWVYQFYEINVQERSQSIRPRFRRDAQPMPDTRSRWQDISESMERFKADTASFEDDLSLAQVAMVDADLSALATMKREIEYYTIWARYRGNDPLTEAFRNALSSYTDLPHARYAHAVLQAASNARDASEWRIRAGQVTDIRMEESRYQAHSSDPAFGDPAETRNRLQNLFRFTQSAPDRINQYDVRLAFALCVRIWEQEVQGPIGDALRESERNRLPINWRIERETQARFRIQESATWLLFILKRSPPNEVSKAIDYLYALQTIDGIVPKRTAYMLYAVLTRPSNRDVEGMISTLNEGGQRVHAVFIREVKDMSVYVLEADTVNRFRELLILDR